jgi:NAD(P)-dependent dehydrogenase (short-subunit alcohol dehydrogenase family)
LVLLPDGERAIFKAFAEVRDSPGVCELGIPDMASSVLRGETAAVQVPGGDTATDERTAIGLLKARTPLGVPWIEPADVAPLVVFLASDQARMVSGTSFAVTGGDSAHLTA